METDEYESIQLISVTDFVEEYYKMTKELYQAIAAGKVKKKETFDGYLSADEELVKEKLAGNIPIPVPQVSKALLEFIIRMEWHTEKCTPPVPHHAVHDALVHLESVLAKSSDWELLSPDGSGGNEGPLSNISDFEVNMLEQVVSFYLAVLLDENHKETMFFPLRNGLDDKVTEKWRILEKIATVKVIHQRTIYQQKLSEYLKRRIQSEVSTWFNEELKKLKGGKSNVPKDFETLRVILHDLTEHLTIAVDVLGVEGSLFEASCCYYFDAVAETLDSQLYPVIQKWMDCLDKYHVSHKAFQVNIRDSCTVCYAFYIALKKLVQCLKEQVKMQSTIGRLSDFSHLFGDSFLQLLHVLKAESHFRINRTMLLESQDTIHEDENILSSSIIVLNCLCTVLNEYQELEIEDEELQIAFLVKITDTVCDGAKIFAEALEQRAENANLYIKDPSFLRKICILANSVEHVRGYLENLPKLMRWSEVLQVLVGTPSSLSLKKQILRILDLMHTSMDTHLNVIARDILQMVVLHVRTSSEKYLNSWLSHSMSNQNLDRFLAHLSDQLQPIHEAVREPVFQRFLKDLWMSFLIYIKEGFQEGHCAEYARRIKQNVDELQKYLVYLKMEITEEMKTAYGQVLHPLNLNSKTTVELQLEYYGHLADLLISPLEYLGHIAFQAGYKKSGREVIDLHVRVQKGQRIPVRRFEINQLVVTVDLCPTTIFPNVQSMKTKPASEELDHPTFNETFHFNKLPATVLNIKGAVIQLLLINQDGSYSAEAVLNLKLIQNFSNLASMEFLPVYLMPLRRFDGNQPSFKVLESRSRWDRHAKIFVNKRLKAIKSHKKVMNCIPGRKYMCGLAGKE